VDGPGAAAGAIVVYLAAGWSVIAALGLAGLTLAVHATALGGGLSHLIGACVHRFQATYGTSGGATVAAGPAPALAAGATDSVQRIQRLLGPSEPLGRARRRRLRATAAALALTPVLLALTPAVVALALGKLPAA
jgi:hypothetical protein